MKRFLMMAAVVAGISLTGLTGESMAGVYGPSRGFSNYNYGAGSFGMGGYSNGWGYRGPVQSHCGPRMPVRRFNTCNKPHVPGYGYGYGYNGYNGYGNSGYRW